MSVEKVKVFDKPVSIGCYRRRFSFVKDNIYFIDYNNIILNNEVIYENRSEIFDIISFKDGFVIIDNHGDVYYFIDKNIQKKNVLDGHAGIFSAVEVNDVNVIAAHDLSHTVRIICHDSFDTLKTIDCAGIPCALGLSNTNIVVFCFDKTIATYDIKFGEMEKSPSLSFQPNCIAVNNEDFVVSTEDRCLYVYFKPKETKKNEISRLSIKNFGQKSKPTTKNGTSSLWLKGNDIICVGVDESMTLANIDSDLGQFKLKKYLAESPFVSAPVPIENGFATLTRNGILHKFTNPVEFLQQQHAVRPSEEQ